MIKNFKSIKLSKIYNFLNLKYNAITDCIIKNVSNLDKAKKGDITLCFNSKYLNLLKNTNASACIISKKFLRYVPKNCFPIISTNPQIDFIKVSNLFYSDYFIDKISKNYLTQSKIKKNLKKLFLAKILYVKKML